MTQTKRIVLSSDHADIELRKTLAAYVESLGYEVVDIGPQTSYSVEKLAVFAALDRRMNGFRLDFIGRLWPVSRLVPTWLTF